jgi:hypothetical protein
MLRSQNINHYVNNMNIEKALIVHKKYKKFTTKSLEFYYNCNNEINDIEFEYFIKDMINNGFGSLLN